MVFRERIRIVVAALAATVIGAGSTHAQGWIEPRVQTVDWGAEKLRTTVNVRVAGRVAHVEVEEWFRNNGRDMAEGDYVYPLPGDAVFSSYSLYQGDQELRGEMMDAGTARDIYERIVRARRDPALIELVGKGMVRARVFPIEAGQTRRITLRYTQVLERAGDALQFRYAAGLRGPGTVMAPMPQPMPVPRPAQRRGEAPRVVAEGTPIEFTITVEDAARYRDAFSPTHNVRVERRDGRMIVRPARDLAGDFAVFLPLAQRAVGMTLATHRPEGDDGYFMLTLSPEDVRGAAVPRDVTVVVDVSGSMSGEKIEQARGALHQLLGSLGAADRVRLIAFSGAVRPWRTEWTPADPAELRSAAAWVDALRAEGGTNISGALAAAFSAPTSATRLPVVIFMTDGLPTNGETDVERIAAMAESSRGRTRVFAFGVGYDVNTALLDRLSEAARGSTQYVRPGEDVEQAVSVLGARIRHPVLTDLALERGGARITEIYPRDLPDLFAGEELVLFGRYAGSASATLAITGRRGSNAERYDLAARFPARMDANDYIPRLWAARKLGDLDRRIRSAQADGANSAQVNSMIEELRRTALRYGLLSQYTSYLVQEPGVVATDASVRLPAPQAAPPPAAVVGQGAVAQAEEARRSREVASVADMAAVQNMAAQRMEASGKAGSSNVRVIAGRTFTLRDGVWHDARQARQRVIAVEPFSEAYFAVVRALPELGLVLRELDAVLVAGERVSLRVAPGGARTLPAGELKGLVTEFRGH